MDHLYLHHLITAISALGLCSCTVNVSQVHTDGTATDIIDTDQRTDPEIKTDLKIPGAL